MTLATEEQLRDDCLVRLNSACLTGEVFGCDRCDCSWQLWESLRLIAADGNGILVYLPDHDGRGAGAYAKTLSYAAQDRFDLSTAEAFDHVGVARDSRSYDAAIAVLQHAGISKLRLLTNNPQKIEVVKRAGISVERQRLVPDGDRYRKYLASKQHAFGHWIESVAAASSETGVGELP